jgi:hypothetical protein
VGNGLTRATWLTRRVCDRRDCIEYPPDFLLLLFGEWIVSLCLDDQVLIRCSVQTHDKVRLEILRLAIVQIAGTRACSIRSKPWHTMVVAFC